MHKPILFKANKEKWEKTPSTIGTDEIILLEDIPGRIVLLCRNVRITDNPYYTPYTSQDYSVYEHKGDIDNFYQEIACGNYECQGIYDVASDNSAGEHLRFKELLEGDS